MCLEISSVLWFLVVGCFSCFSSFAFRGWGEWEFFCCCCLVCFLIWAKIDILCFTSELLWGSFRICQSQTVIAIITYIYKSKIQYIFGGKVTPLWSFNSIFYSFFPSTDSCFSDEIKLGSTSIAGQLY